VKRWQAPEGGKTLDQVSVVNKSDTRAKDEVHTIAKPQLQPRYAPSAIWAGSVKPVLLTFDDGPCRSLTPKVLQILSEYHIKAIFFVVGEKLKEKENAVVLEQILKEGHLVGNHSYSHPFLDNEPASRILWEIEETQKLLTSFGIRERLFRPPYGRVNEKVTDILMPLGFWGVGWSADTLDWNDAYQPNGWILQGYKDVRKQAENIVNLHDVHASTVEGLRLFIDLLLDTGRTFPPLFDDGEGDASQRLTPSFKGWEAIAELGLFRPTEL
jgi:peptidoglycan/xylan/chitin deacetylase (PgdA/CDA1 family)